MSTPSKSPPDDPVLEITTSILTEAAQRPWLAALLMRRKPYWLTRLAHLAQRVRDLPRHTRRTLRRKLASGLAAAALLLALAGPPPMVYAAGITVDGDGTVGTCSLADAITSANTDTATGYCPAGSGDDAILLTVDVNLTAPLPDIASNITLEGGGHTIQGDNTFTVLTVSYGSNFALNQATISGATTPRPPQVGQPAHDRTTISGNHDPATRHSGNWARERAGVNRPEDASSGGIFNSGTLTVTNSTITGHTAAYGAGIFNSGTATVTDSTISYNTATNMGGGIFSYHGNTTVQHSTISDNAATMGGGILSYGANTLVTNNSTLSGNSANNDGGGIANIYGTATVSNSTLSGNTALGNGGGIFNYYSMLAVQSSTISGNTADGGGGGIYNAGNTATVENSALTGNRAYHGGGIANTYNGTTTVTNASTLSGNAAYYDGGGIYNVYGGSTTIENSTLSGNQAEYGDGGGIYNSATLTVTNTATLSANSANYGDGGGIYNGYGGNAIVEGSTLSGNTAYRQGGGIYNSNTLTVTNSTLSTNTASSGGGIANAYGGDTTVTNSTLSGNTANNSIEGAANGGGIVNYGGSLLVQNSTISGNTAEAIAGAGRGGGISNYSGTLTVSTSTIVNNNAYGYSTSEGGGIHGTATIDSSIVADNQLGPVVYNDCASYLSSGGYNIESGESCGFTTTGDQQSVDSVSLNLQPLANNGVNPHPDTHALGPGSAAIDQIPDGVNGCAAGASTDERGAVRADGANRGGALCDIGAYEVSAETPLAVTLQDFTATSATATGITGAIGAALTLLGALVIGRRRASVKQRING